MLWRAAVVKGELDRAKERLQQALLRSPSFLDFIILRNRKSLLRFSFCLRGNAKQWRDDHVTLDKLRAATLDDPHTNGVQTIHMNWCTTN